MDLYTTDRTIQQHTRDPEHHHHKSDDATSPSELTAVPLAAGEVQSAVRGPSTSLIAWNGPVRLTRKPALVMLDLHHVRTSKAQLSNVLMTLSQTFYRLSLQVQHLQNSPIKAQCKSVDLTTFTVAVWEDEPTDTTCEDDLVVAVQWTSGDSILFCDYANAILQEIGGHKAAAAGEDSFPPYHTVELPKMNDECKQYLLAGNTSASEEARKFLDHIADIMRQDGMDYRNSSWLRKLQLWTDPRKINPFVALEVGKMILDGKDCLELQNTLLQAAFPSRDLQGDIEDDSIVALLVVAVMVETVLRYDSPDVSRTLVTQFLSFLNTNNYLSACVLNIRQANTHPHVAFASVNLMHQLASLEVESFKILKDSDTEEAIIEARRFGAARHAALEGECSRILSKYFFGAHSQPEDSTSSKERKHSTAAQSHQEAEALPVAHATALTTDEDDDEGEETVFYETTTMEDVNQ